jgi:SseB protein N-terminal domain
MEPIDYTEPWMVLSDEKGSGVDFVRALVCGQFWFPVDYHPELGDPFEPDVGDKVPFWIGEDADGEFIPIYSSPEVMRLCLERSGQLHSRARMKGARLLVALGQTGHAMVINPGTKTPLMVPASGIGKLSACFTKGEKFFGE